MAAAAGACALPSYCINRQASLPSDVLVSVELDERPEDKWIEVEQRKRADGFIDWTSMGVSSDYVRALRALRSSFKLPIDTMLVLREHFMSEAAKGLAGEPSSLKMLPTFVTKRVTGAEKGDFFALDLGGTNFRVLRLRLEGDGVVGPVTSMKFSIPDDVKTGTGDELFGFLADSVARFCALECGGNPHGSLGFTFSFPVEQTALNAGKLLVWNKGFGASGCLGEDVVALLQQQFESRGIELRVEALANDTVGTMEAAAYRRPDTAMGVILGTGTNACYVEKTANVTKWDGKPSDEMVLNTEWGNLQMAAFMNGYDRAVDAATTNPGLQTFEKMISGMYLGEICRVALLDPTVARGFSADARAGLKAAFGAKGSLESATLAAIEADTSPTLAEAERLLAGMGVSTTPRDRALLREACVCVSTRAARLSATAVGALLDHARMRDACTVAVDGTVFEKYPWFNERMEAGLVELLGPERADGIKLVLAKDGSGIGAAIIACLA